MYSGLKYRTAKPLYVWCTELDADNSYEGNDLEKGSEVVPKNNT